MKPQRAKAKKVKREPIRKSNPVNRPGITVPWGRGASEYRPGLFTRQYFVEHGEACCADAFYALKEDLEHMNKERVEIGETPIRGGTYNSFAKYWHWFKLLDLIEPVNRREPAIYDFLEKRQFYRLTNKGRAEEQIWRDPVRAAHPKFG
jgi:hypothetical protein